MKLQIKSCSDENCTLTIEFNNYNKIGREAISEFCGITTNQYLGIALKNNAVIYHNGIEFLNYNDTQRCIEELEPYLIMNKLVGDDK